jgi:exodeoxyribonuclease V alpha subunit
MMRRFLSSHCGPGVDFVGEGGLERFALQSFLCGRLDAAELMQERMVCGTRPDGIRLIVLALMARLHAGHPRATGDDLVAEAESILSTLPENVPPDFDIASHREIVSRKSTEIVLSIHSALDLISASPGSFAPLFGAGEGDPRPLVCIEKGAFSFARLHAAQRDLVDQISRRAVGCAPWTDERIAHAMSAVDALPGHALHPDQRAAVERSLHRPFLVLTGGPGTGKTTVVSRILLALSKVMDDFDPESVGLCAPTGRAKARLAESIGQNLASLSALDPVAASLSNVPAATLHSLLGALPNGTFRHHPGNPLPHRVVVLDEASMVDLPLFAAFLEALSPSARVILVGDPDQLPSVDAGAVLADLVANPNLGASCAHLSHTHRNAGAIAEICRVVREGGDVAATLAASRRKSTDMPAVRAVVGLVAHLGDERIETLLPLWLEERFGASMRSAFQAGTGFGDPAALLSLVERSRILCAVHDGRSGASALNAQADVWLRERFPSSWHGRFAPGQQVILTRNHALRDLWNGDLGVVVEHDARLVAVFSKPGKILAIPVEQLDGLESAWAVTVHKSQGSEFEEILFVLPERDSPVLTRQILYTALSRARRTVFVHGDAELAAKAVSRSADRPSAVREAQIS